MWRGDKTKEFVKEQTSLFLVAADTHLPPCSGWRKIEKVTIVKILLIYGTNLFVPIPIIPVHFNLRIKETSL